MNRLNDRGYKEMKVDLKTRILLLTSFFITLIGNFLDYINVISDANTLIVYIFMLLPIAVGIIPLCQCLLNKAKMKYTSELKTGIFLFISFIVISNVKAYQVDANFSFFPGEAIRLFVPFLYAFIIVNFLSMHDIEMFMKFGLIISIVSFFISTDFSTITLKDIFSISFSNSYSPFENSKISFLSFTLASFFIYYRDKFPGWTIASMIMVFLSFKRVYILGVLILLIASTNFFRKVKIKKWILYISSLMWILLIELYMFLLNPLNYNWEIDRFHFDIVNFSMSRAYRVWYLIQNNYLSSGLTSTTKFLQDNFFFNGTTLELDLIKILMELGILGIIILVICYYQLVRESFYAYLLMSILLLQFLMASGIDGYLEMSIVFISMAVVNYNNSILGE